MRVRDWINEIKNLCIGRVSKAKSQGGNCNTIAKATVIINSWESRINYAWFHLSPNTWTRETQCQGEPLVTASMLSPEVQGEKGKEDGILVYRSSLVHLVWHAVSAASHR